ncbi:MAG TPA: carboxypeptidase-like regulatory domain-containing protein [archaeon]|nr:carboxypeptidase-like regulatory domain-containing protein [archaeon]
MEFLDNIRDSLVSMWESQDRAKLLAGAGLIAIVVLGLVFLSISGLSAGQLTVVTKNSSGEALWKTSVKLSGLEGDFSGTTDRSGTIVFSGVPAGKKFTIEAFGTGFETSKTDFILTKSAEETQITLKAEQENAPALKVITFAGPDGVKLDKKLITVELSCSSGLTVNNSVQQVSNGRLEVEAPSGCGVLSATISAAGFETDTFNLNESSVIRLQALQTEQGRAIVVVKDAAGRFLDNIEVSILDSRGIPTGEVEITSFGEASFSLDSGKYIARAYDSTLAYASAQTEFSIAAKSEARAAITLEEKPLATITAKVIDKSSKAEVKNATVVLESPDGAKISREFNGGNVSLALSKIGIYKLSASADGYARSNEISVNSASIPSQGYTLEIAKCMPATCGILTVSVRDEDNEPVANARVAIVNLDTGFFAEEYGLKYTDINGAAKFSGVKTGKYNAIVQKYPAEGSSEPFDAVTGTDARVKAQLTIGEGTIEVLALDPDGKPVAFGFAEFRSEGRERLGKLPLNSQGKAAFTTKADKKVFVTLSADGYTNYTSGGTQVYPGKIVSINAELRREILGDGPGIEFIGLFDESGRAAGAIFSGNAYSARFIVSVPENSADELEQLGVFIRTGEDSIVEKDPIYINSVDAPRASVLKGSTYSEPKGTEEDEAHITNGEAKWASIVWDRSEIRQGLYEAAVEIKARESATPGASMPIFYRAYGVKEDGSVVRDPIDTELGTGEETSAKHALYAKSYEKEYAEGAIEECDEDFCYSQRIIDTKNDLYLTPPYQLRIFGNYTMEFSITNNSRSVHDSSNIRIKNSVDGTILGKSLRIISYNITNAASQQFSSSTPAFEISPIALGDFRENKEIRAKLMLKPEVLGLSALDIRIVSDREQVFTRQVQVNVVNEKDLNVSVRPLTMPAFTQFDLNVEARFFSTEADFDEVEGAFVRVERATPDRQKSTFTSITDGEGKARIRIPASPPGTRIKVRVEKDGFAGKEHSFEISKSVVSFNPASIKSSLDLTTNTEQRVALEATNLVPIELTVSEMRFAGDFKGLLDSSRMNNWLDQYVGKSTLAHGSTAQFTLLSAISDDAKQISEIRKLNARLVFEVSTKDGGIKWPMEVPAQIAISLAEPPKNPGCIEVGLKEWKDATLGGKAEIEFYIKNGCVGQNGKPLDLRSLKAKIAWKSNKYGNVELHVTDHENAQEASEALSEGDYSTLFESVPGGKEYTAILVFTPKGGTIGKKAEFSVLVDAAQNAVDGEQLVGASNQIAAQIDIIDLSQCVKYTPEPESGVRLEETQSDAKLDIDASACGNVNIDFWLCKDDKDCSGGAEGGITVSPEQFTLTPQSAKKSVVVSRQQIPGLYGIGVFVRTPGSNYRQINTVDVLAKPTKEDAFELFKYEFSAVGKGSQDSTELTNRFFVEDIGVDASICDWGDATEKGWFDWKFAGIGAIVGAIKGMQPAMAAAKEAAKTLSTQTSNTLKAAQSAQDASSASNAASTSTAEALCSKVKSAQAAVASAQAACSGSSAAAAVGGANTAMTSANTACEKAKEQVRSAGLLDTVIRTALRVIGIPFSGNTSAVAGATQNAQKQGSNIALTQSDLSAIQGNITTANSELGVAHAAISDDCSNVYTSGICLACNAALGTADSQVAAANGAASSYSGGQLPKSATDTASTASAGQATQQAATSTWSKMLHPLRTMTSSFGPSGIMAAYTVGGFMVGGLLGGLFGTDPCAQHTTANLPDYRINLLDDVRGIESGSGKFGYAFGIDSAKIIGTWEKQRIGLVATNSGVSSAKPVYDTVTLSVAQHLHTNPTKIDAGNKDFGPFKVPDQQKINVDAKLHLKFKTQDVEEQIPELDFDTVSCVAGNKIGRTGNGALPRIKLDWGFGEGGIGNETCLESNQKGVYCDATQFSITLSKRLNSLREFFSANQNLRCPANPLSGQFGAIHTDLNAQQSLALSTSCYISDWSGYTDGEPTIQALIEANKNTIVWTNEIPNAGAFMDTVHFNALLIKDGYSDDFKGDFAHHYSTERFFDTPDWFAALAKDSTGRDYGVGRLFEQNMIKFTNRFFDSAQLSSAGVHEVLISIRGDNGKFTFFNADGTANAGINVEFYLIQEPSPNSAFYSIPFDGLVGLEGDSFNRQGYGTSFINSETGKLIAINNEAEPAKTYNDGGSNPVTFVNSHLEKSFYGLNASPSQRGNLLSIEKTAAGEADLRFAPSKATPVTLKVNAGSISAENLAAFYRITATEAPVDSGQTATYWDGAGACLDNTGTLITESFDTRPDRAAQPRDPVLNWQSAYGVDFGPVNYTGEVYIRTIFYTNPLEQFAIASELPAEKMQFITPDSKGSKVALGGVSGEQFNNPLGGTSGTVGSISDVFGLVQNEKVCVVDSGRNAQFFWNPKSIYEMGEEKSISNLSNSLVAGQTCIGLGD